MSHADANTDLHWDVFVTPGIPIVTRDKPPGIRETFFQATASTLIYGVRDAVLVDAFMTVKQMLELHPNRVNPGWALWSSARAVKA
jgi:hypothetical protein